MDVFIFGETPASWFEFKEPVRLGFEASRTIGIFELAAWVNPFCLVEIGAAGFMGLSTLLFVGDVLVFMEVPSNFVLLSFFQEAESLD